MSQRVLVVEEPPGLDRLLAARYRGRRIAVRLAWLDRPGHERLERRLAALVGACGCTAGTVVLIGALAGYGVYLGVGSPPAGFSLAERIGSGIGIALAGAATGKAIGLVGARLLLRYMIRRLRFAEVVTTRRAEGLTGAPSLPTGQA